MCYERTGELDEALTVRIDELLAEAKRVDTEPVDDGQTLPEPVAWLEKLRDRMRRARADLEQRANKKAEAERAAYQARQERHEARNGRGNEPTAPDDTPGAKESDQPDGCG